LQALARTTYKYSEDKGGLENLINPRLLAPNNNKRIKKRVSKEMKEEGKEEE
jgi:hypothetical protein